MTALPALAPPAASPRTAVPSVRRPVRLGEGAR
jgi:hypothetical protein